MEHRRQVRRHKQIRLVPRAAPAERHALARGRVTAVVAQRDAHRRVDERRDLRRHGCVHGAVEAGRVCIDLGVDCRGAVVYGPARVGADADVRHVGDAMVLPEPTSAAAGPVRVCPVVSPDVQLAPRHLQPVARPVDAHRVDGEADAARLAVWLIFPHVSGQRLPRHRLPPSRLAAQRLAHFAARRLARLAAPEQALLGFARAALSSMLFLRRRCFIKLPQTGHHRAAVQRKGDFKGAALAGHDRVVRVDVFQLLASVHVAIVERNAKHQPPSPGILQLPHVRHRLAVVQVRPDLGRPDDDAKRRDRQAANPRQNPPAKSRHFQVHQQ
mmetsp:Transcript_15882/g.54173  ORF Transcript_15882/g.54173 Transcript_15882/m.54173 type:complete len:328 (+) Transcript_15882:1642-2625(+)